MCFEQDREQCHRGLWAAWWYVNVGEDVQEHLIGSTEVP